MPDQTTPPKESDICNHETKGGCPAGALFGYVVVLSVHEMMTLIRAMSETVHQLRWFAENAPAPYRIDALVECGQKEARLAELKAMKPEIIKPNADGDARRETHPNQTGG